MFATSGGRSETRSGWNRVSMKERTEVPFGTTCRERSSTAAVAPKICCPSRSTPASRQ